MKLIPFIFGYRELKVDKEKLPLFVGELLKLGVCAEVKADGRVTVSEADYKKIKSNLLKYILQEEKKGFISHLGGALKHKGVIIGLCLALILNIILSFFVWDVRIEGNEDLSDRAVKGMLSDAGLEVGSLWGKFDKNSIEASVLGESEDIAWLSVYRRGSVAYVKIVESERLNAPIVSDKKGNIVADRDCIIEEITVERGTAVVKVGDVVREGEVLISGITESEGVTLIDGAKGQVKGRAMRDISIFVPKEALNLDFNQGKLCALSLKVFKFELNIFKNYRNSHKGYDIIENEKEFVLFGKCKLPFSLVYSYPISGRESTVEYTDLELINIARERMAAAIYTLFGSDDVVGIRTSGEFAFDGYYCRSTVTYVGEVGQIRELDIN